MRTSRSRVVPRRRRRSRLRRRRRGRSRTWRITTVTRTTRRRTRRVSRSARRRCRTGLIAPTQTSCSDVLNGTAAVLGQINYSVSDGKIGQGINPGVFFFYSKITTTVPNQVVTVTQSNTSSNNTPLFEILNGQAWLYPANCSSHTDGTLTAGGANARFT